MVSCLADSQLLWKALHRTRKAKIVGWCWCHKVLGPRPLGVTASFAHLEPLFVDKMFVTDFVYEEASTEIPCRALVPHLFCCFVVDSIFKANMQMILYWLL